MAAQGRGRRAAFQDRTGARREERADVHSELGPGAEPAPPLPPPVIARPDSGRRAGGGPRVPRRCRHPAGQPARPMTATGSTDDAGTGPGPDRAAQPDSSSPTGPPLAPETLPRWPPATYWIQTTLAVVAAARRATHVLLLVLIAFVLAVGLDPAVRWLGRFRVRRGWAVALIFVGFASFLALFVALLIPVLAREIQQFAGALPGYVADLQERDDWIGDIARRACSSSRSTCSMS